MIRQNGKSVQKGLITLVVVALLATVLLPLTQLFAKAFYDRDGQRAFRAVALLPLFAPTMMHGIALTYLFGNQGLVTTGIFEMLPFSWDIDLYGPVGIILVEIVYVFPQAYLILVVSMAFADYQLYEESKTYRMKESRLRDTFFFLFCLAVSGFLLLLMATVVLASFIKVWPYDLSFGLQHYDFSNVAGEGMGPLWNSILVALITAVIGTAVTFVTAYVIEKTQVWRGLRQAGYFLSILPLALPGMVIGLAYIFFFNNPNNPFHGLYGTIWILVLANVIHFFAVSFITATTALKKLDPEFEMAAESMGISRAKVFWRVTVPVCTPAIIEMVVYFFINSLVTISAVVFLYAADFKLAAVSIVNMDDAGDVAPAAAMSVLIVVLNIFARAGAEWIAAKIRKRAAWTNQEKEQVA
ncbi:ABC transporter permease subunit [Brevibacillus centrosporus]|uniref:ABC transporter permease subunit n=1 Tax=Brevibacillus centrosporus TaxID=54910 RepID=UPI00380AA84C